MKTKQFLFFVAERFLYDDLEFMVSLSIYRHCQTPSDTLSVSLWIYADCHGWTEQSSSHEDTPPCF